MYSIALRGCYADADLVFMQGLDALKYECFSNTDLKYNMKHVSLYRMIDVML